MKRIILDTNFLLIPHTLKVDIFSEIERVCDFPYQICVFEGTKTELESIMQKETGKARDAARVGLSLIKQKNLYILTDSDSGYIDDSILNAADSETVVATQDRELKQKLHKKGAKLLILRNKKHLVID